MIAGRRVIACALIVAVALLSSTAGRASTGPDDSARNNDWVAVGAAHGTAAVEQDGVLVAWDGELSVVFKYNVDEAGLVNGTWIIRGGAYQDVEIEEFSAYGDLLYDGSGTVGGDESTLVATGSVKTTGVIEPFGLSVDNDNPVGPLSIEVDTWCDEMWGTWELTVQDAFEDAGFSGRAGFSEFVGTFIGHVRFEGFSDEAIAELAEYGLNQQLLDSVAADYSIEERVELDETRLEAHLFEVTATSWRLRDTYPDWAEADVYAAVDAHRGLLNVLRNLSDCSRSIIGEDVLENWTDVTAQSLERIIEDLVELDLFTGEPLEPQGFARVGAAEDSEEPGDATQATLAYLQLVDFSMRSAVIGAGALDPDAANRSERALIDAGSRLLTGLDAAGGNADDRRRVLLAGALMGWQFDVGGTSVDAAAALADLGPAS